GAPRVGRVAQSPRSGARQALLLFARFGDEGAAAVPAWADQVFDPSLPRSFSHYWDTMSFGRLQVRGQVAPRVYAVPSPASAYVAAGPTEKGQYGRFVREVLGQADAEVDFARFDNDGPDGAPGSRDDDGRVDALFVGLATVPRGFLLDGATGMGDLGLEEDFTSADRSGTGLPVRIGRHDGTVQQGRTFVEAVGAMAHEYGHVLGLPDLYEVPFLQERRSDPAQDAAGVGRWCLMGWGASGWQPGDGPASLCGWSRASLGWTSVEEVDQQEQEVRLPSIGQGGNVARIPLRPGEYFLLEHRRRDTDYDRHLPAEGLLVWHVREGESHYYLGERPPEADSLARTVVDLECADGGWADAGYPQGRVPDARGGGDNLDFWAHDAAYAQAHGGNLGDATDPFDGVRFTAFTPQTNPAALSLDGQVAARVEGIGVEGSLLVARVVAPAPQAEIVHLGLSDANGDSVVSAGEEVQVHFEVAHQGGIAARDLRARLLADDARVEVVVPEVALEPLPVGGTVWPKTRQQLAFRLAPDLPGGTYRTTLSVQVTARGAPLCRGAVAVTGASARREPLAAGVMDTLGNGDGRAQVGEVIELALAFADTLPERLAAWVTLGLRSLDPRVVPVTLGRSYYEAAGEHQQFLVTTAVPPGTVLRFELLGRAPYQVWRDTLLVRLAEGPDRTPLHLGRVQAVQARDGLRLRLDADDLWEGSDVTSVVAVVRAEPDGAEVARVPLAPQPGGHYAGVWSGAYPGHFRVAATAADAAGNVGQGPPLRFTVDEASPTDVEGTARLRGWEPVALPEAPWRPRLHTLVRSAAEPAALYLRTAAHVWSSRDEGQSWRLAGRLPGGAPEMLGSGMPGVLADPADPRLLYARMETVGSRSFTTVPRWARTADGGSTWEPLPLPPGADLLEIGPPPACRIYAVDWYPLADAIGAFIGGYPLLVSEDGGLSWTTTPVRLGWRDWDWLLVVEAEVGRRVYAGPLSRQWGAAYRSGDGGLSWTEAGWNRSLASVAADPASESGLYATAGDTVLHSADHGRTWEELARLADGRAATRIVVHPRAPRRLLVWSGARFWVSPDAGATWQVRRYDEEGYEWPGPGSVPTSRLVFDPEEPDRLLLGPQGERFWWSGDGGLTWEEVAGPQSTPSLGALAWDPGGRLVTGTSAETGSGRVMPRLYCRSPRGEWTLVDGSAPVEAWGALQDGLTALFLDPGDPGVLLARGNDVLVRTQDGGLHWDLATPPRRWWSWSEFDAWAAQVADPRWPTRRYLSTWGLFGSRDAGVTWEKLPASPSPAEPFCGVAFDPADTGRLCAGVGEDLWCSSDDGETWSASAAVVPGQRLRALVAHADEAGRQVSTGVYLCRLQAATRHQVQRLALVR
ncbi:MAG: immune inhibitor A domain-containing protein, partial [Candidatus Latescibacterota bacterium]